jgi:DNA polymerase sigma
MKIGINKHLGIISTEMMKQWLGFYPGLFNTAIILK